MRFRRLLGSVLPGVFGLLTLPVLAQSSRADDARGGWMLGVGAQADEEGGDSLLANVYAGVGSRTWLTVVAGRSTSPEERADIKAETLAIGIDHKLDAVGFTFDVERWGDSDALETHDLAASVYFDRERWRIDVGYETRDLEIPFTLTGPFGGTLRRDAQVDGDSVSVDARVALGDRWQLYVGAARYDYERDLALLPRIQSINLLSTSTLTLANSFLDEQRYVAVEREIGSTLLNVRATTDRSAIDGSKFETLEAAVLFPLGGRVDLEVNVGNGRSELFESGLYGGLLFLVYGR